MDSSFALSWAILHDGVMRRSDDAFSDRMKRGTSRAVWRDMMDCGEGE